MDDVVQALIKLENLEELYEVTGEFDIVTLLSAADIEEFREVLKNKIMKIKGVKSTVSSVVLKAYKGPRCLEEEPHRITESQKRPAYSFFPTWAGFRSRESPPCHSPGSVF